MRLDQISTLSPEKKTFAFDDFRDMLSDATRKKIIYTLPIDETTACPNGRRHSKMKT